MSALIDAGNYELLVGIDGGSGDWRVYRNIWQRHGLLGLLRRLRTKYAVAITRRLRGLGLLRGDAQSLRELVARHQLRWVHCAPLNEAAVQSMLRDFAPDLLVVANFGQIVREPLLSLPRCGAINLHPSLLPRYRGPVPYYWVLANGEERTGLTIHCLDAGLDSGAILSQHEITIHPGDDEASLRRRTVAAAPGLLAQTVADVLAGRIQPEAQDESQASYFGFPPAGGSRL